MFSAYTIVFFCTLGIAYQFIKLNTFSVSLIYLCSRKYNIVLLYLLFVILLTIILFFSIFLPEIIQDIVKLLLNLLDRINPNLANAFRFGIGIGIVMHNGHN